MPAVNALERVSSRRYPARAKRPELRLERQPDGQFVAVKGGVRTSVRVQRCFPWTSQARFLSLRDEKEHEVALIESPADLDEGSRQALEGALAEAGFILQVAFILSVEEIYELRHWRVETQQGPRVFQTKLDDWPRDVPGGGYLVRDITGDLYHCPDPEELDEKSRQILWELVD